jgi:hypothetical protein
LQQRHLLADPDQHPLLFQDPPLSGQHGVLDRPGRFDRYHDRLVDVPFAREPAIDELAHVLGLCQVRMLGQPELAGCQQFLVQLGCGFRE